MSRANVERAPIWGLALSIAIGTFGCARGNERPVGYSLDVAVVPPKDDAPKQKHKPVPRDAVQRAERGFSGLRHSDGQWLPEPALLNELARYDVICFGEQHDEVEHHYAEYALFLGLSRRTRGSGRELGLGLEMFERGASPTLDAFVAGKISEAEFLERTEYEERWGFPFAYYEPLLNVARSQRLRVLGLNAERELVREVAREGLESLSRQERRSLPELNLEDDEHREQFEAMMKHHPKGHGSQENMYAAQVIWDETMAEAANKWLGAHLPVRQLFIVAGRAHCAESAIPSRIQRRSNVSVASITPGKSDEKHPGYGFTLVFE